MVEYAFNLKYKWAEEFDIMEGMGKTMGPGTRRSF